jgi:N-acetylmuramoyl-L-alanine amidase
MTFPPDSQLVAAVSASPNHGERVGVDRPDMLILHYTGMTDPQAALDLLCNPASRLSAHYLVHEDGRIIQLVPEARRAWHAGISSWEGKTDLNSHSIGIEIVNPGHSYGYPDFPEPQIAAVIALCRDILARHPAILPHHVLAHSDVAPSRKNDPGEKFPWARLHAAGIGHWVKPVDLGKAHGPTAGDRGPQVEQIKEALSAYGYEVGGSREFDEPMQQAIVAFQRHFRPARVDGIADHSTVETLRQLVGARDSATVVRKFSRPGASPLVPKR